jgi:hypothetical protein
LLIGITGCSKSDVNAPPEPPKAEPAPPPNAIQLVVLATLAPNRVTHLAATAYGVACAQETADGKQAVSLIDLNGICEPTDLNPTLAGFALFFARNATGNFQGIAADKDNLYFYFSGTNDTDAVAGIGTYSLKLKDAKVVANTRKITELTGNPDAVASCRGEMTRAGDFLWLWLHSSDHSYFIQMDLTSVKPVATLQRGFIDPDCDVDKDLQFNQANSYAIGGAGDGSILMTDLFNGILWKISPDGVTRARWPLAHVPKNISSPTVDDHARAVLFISPGDAISPHLPLPDAAPLPTTEFPALAIIDAANVQTIGKSALIAKPGVDISALHIDDLTRAVDGKSWVGYDLPTGIVYRLTPVHQ